MGGCLIKLVTSWLAPPESIFLLMQWESSMSKGKLYSTVLAPTSSRSLVTGAQGVHEQWKGKEEERTEQVCHSAY